MPDTVLGSGIQQINKIDNGLDLIELVFILINFNKVAWVLGRSLETT